MIHVPGIGQLVIGDFFAIDEFSKLTAAPGGLRVGTIMSFGVTFKTNLLFKLFDILHPDLHVYSVKKLPAIRNEPKTFDLSAGVFTRISGFEGVRLAIATGVEIDGSAIESSLGADVGLRVSMEARSPPFPQQKVVL